MYKCCDNWHLEFNKCFKCKKYKDWQTELVAFLDLPNKSEMWICCEKIKNFPYNSKCKKCNEKRDDKKLYK